MKILFSVPSRIPCAVAPALGNLIAWLIVFAVMNTGARAEDTQPDGLSGAWIMKFNSPNGDKIRLPLALKQEGEKITGHLKRPDGTEGALEDGAFRDGQITFAVQTRRNQRTFTSKYTGKLEDGKLKGSFESNFGGQSRTLRWEASRKRTDGTGVWKWTFMREDGQPMEFTLKLKEENNQLSGISVSPSGQETSIADGTAKDNEVAFKVVRERDDRKFTTRFHGKRSEDVITGKLEADWTGEVRSYDWTAKRVSDEW